jgi:Ala-tRNA(Pro) deacylase
MLKVYKGRPDDCEAREAREVRVYDFLDKLGVKYKRVDHEPADNMEVCAQIDLAFDRLRGESFNAASDGAQHPIICKNLFLCNRQQTNFYLLLMPGDKKFLTKDLSSQINSARLSFADDGAMLKYLDVKPGSVSVMGLMNDKDNAVQLLIDEDVMQSQWFGCHPCKNTSSLCLHISDLVNVLLGAMHHEAIVVKL